MAQLIFKDSGLLIHEGQPPIIYQNWPSYNEETHTIVFVEQEFPNRRRENQIWFYFPTLDLFFQNDRSEHAAIKAFRTLLDAERFYEIIDCLDECGAIHECLHCMEIAKFRRKLERLRSASKITIQEKTIMDDLVVHLDGSPPIG